MALILHLPFRRGRDRTRALSRTSTDLVQLTFVSVATLAALPIAVLWSRRIDTADDDDDQH